MKGLWIWLRNFTTYVVLESHYHKGLCMNLLNGLPRRVPLVEQELFIPFFCGIHVTRSLDLCVCLVDLCLTFLWPLCCLSVFDLQIMITLLVSSNSSWHFLAKSSMLKMVTYQIKLADLQLSMILNSVGMSIPVSSQISLSL